MNDDLTVFGVIFILGVTCYAMRAGGYVVAASLRDDGITARFLRLAPGNLFVAFIVGGCLSSGLTALVGIIVAVATMAVTDREWAALGAGFAAALATSALGM
ncbi:AzlD domain-containing protein [Bradyrhizobium genosp. L]|uniref:AzlD domain-containing protein n=1 Tax=Bradyrhizobium genosp. L TaxID=83637 RepID=UPI0018A250A0|nr:AzlD domain-containing protein [Bradyrhizobium genosp. L]QPF85684.1 AzlD domain-containing protein [Bradyrhizobium genosp. L]